MAKSIQIKIQTTADLKGVQDVKKALQSITQATRQAGSAKAADPFKDLGQSAAKAEKETLRYASALASAQKATGDTAGAVSTLEHALSQMTPGTIEAHQATTKLGQAQKQLQKELSGGASFAKEFGSSVASSFTSMLGPAALAATAIGAIGKAGELIELGTQAQKASKAFNELSAQAGTSGDVILGALRKASAGTISDLNLQLAANRAQLLGVAHSAEQFAALMEIARDRAEKMGTTTESAFSDLVTGLGRASPMILDNLGITVKVGEANETYAKSIGKTVDALTEAEKKQALINAVMEQGKASISGTGDAAETTATKHERMNAQLAKAKLGQLLALKAGPVADDISKVADAAMGGTDALTGMAAASSAVNDAFGFLNPPINLMNSYNQAVLNAAKSGLEWAGVIETTNDMVDDAQRAVAAAAEAASRAGDQYRSTLADGREEAVQANHATTEYGAALLDIRGEAMEAARGTQEWALRTEDARKAMTE